MSVTLTKPTVGADNGTWGTELNAALDALNAADLFAVRTADGTGLTSATLADDGVLQFTLPVGTHRIEAVYFVTGSANTCDLKVAWAFAGTAANSYRGGVGPSSASTDALGATAQGLRSAGAGNTTVAITASAVYGVDGTNITMVREIATMVVTVAGLLKVQVANNSGAGTTTVKAGSSLWARQVA